MIDATPSSHRPLSGLRVIECGDPYAASHAARLLADAGADVISLIGSDFRVPGAESADYQPESDTDWQDSVGLFTYLNRGKRLLRVDPSSPTRRPDLKRLIGAADVVICRKPEDFERLVGSSLSALRTECPGLIVVSVAAFGLRGPRAQDQADDLITLAGTDLLYATPGIPDRAEDLEAEPPLRSNTYFGEFIGGLMGAIGAVFALINRDQTGRGDLVEVSKQEAVAAMMGWDLAMFSYGGHIIGRRPTHILQSPNHYLPIADGWAVLVAFLEPHWRALVDLMGNPDWAGDPRFATGHTRGEHWGDLESLLLSWLLEQPRDGFLDRVQSRGIPAAPALSLAEAVDNDHVAARRFLVPSGLPGDDRGRLPGDVFVVAGDRRPTRDRFRVIDAIDDLLVAWNAGGEAIPPNPAPARVRSSPLPLAGLRVVDLGQIVAMPLAGQWLAWLGADVIYVESSLRPASRGFAPFAGEPPHDTCGIFNHINRNKYGCTLNLATPEGVGLAKRLIATADVVTENFSPGTLEKLGLGYEELRRIRPDIILASLSACGSTGSWRNVSALHSGIILLSGLAAITGYPDGSPRIVGGILPDPLSAAFCVLGIVQAIYYRRRTGQGQHLEIAMTEVLQSLMPEAIFEYTRTGQEPPRIGNRHPWKAPHGVYRTAGEDRWLAVSVASAAEWQALGRVIGRTDLTSNPDLMTLAGRRAQADELDAAIAAWARPRRADVAAAALQAAGVPASLVYDARDLLTDAHLRERGFIVEDDHPRAGRRPMPGSPWTFAELPPVKYCPAPLRGADNTYVFRDLLGLSAHEVDRLTADKVIH